MDLKRMELLRWETERPVKKSRNHRYELESEKLRLLGRAHAAQWLAKSKGAVRKKERNWRGGKSKRSRHLHSFAQAVRIRILGKSTEDEGGDHTRNILSHAQLKNDKEQSVYAVKRKKPEVRTV